ncbi:MAG: hypothetical protein KGM24_03800 [Elusimicrobia bacterium]|nr:hypothetical protein [Elusimicrobiota bacterium]
MRRLSLLVLLAAAGLGGCAYLSGSRDVGSSDVEKAASADDALVREDRARTDLGHIENALAEYVKAEKRIPAKVEDLVPKYLAEIPSLDLPECGRESNRVQYYPADVLRDGRVDGTRLYGTGRWGYVHNSHRVVIFVDCLKNSSNGTPWYRVRGIY